MLIYITRQYLSYVATRLLDMARLVWSKIAKVLKEEYVTEDGVCKICNSKIEIEEDNRFKTLSNIYKHFKEKHPDIVEQVREKLKASALA